MQQRRKGIKSVIELWRSGGIGNDKLYRWETNKLIIWFVFQISASCPFLPDRMRSECKKMVAIIYNYSWSSEGTDVWFRINIIWMQIVVEFAITLPQASGIQISYISHAFIFTVPFYTALVHPSWSVIISDATVVNFATVVITEMYKGLYQNSVCTYQCQFNDKAVVKGG